MFISLYDIYPMLFPMFGFMIYPIRQGDEQPNIGTFFWDQNPAGSMDFPPVVDVFHHVSINETPNQQLHYIQKKNPRRIRIHVLFWFYLSCSVMVHSSKQ